ncbi:response regulator transcription factor [Catenulispora yoronensis]
MDTDLLVAGRTPPDVVSLIRSIRAFRPELSPREEVVAYIAAGFTHDQTATRIGLSPHTVDTYLRRVRAKLNAGTTAELIRLSLTGAATRRPG